MAILFYDTETTGKKNDKAPPQDESQPDLVQLAAILTDENLNEVASINCIVYPQAWTIPDEAAAIHGISQDKALKYGISLPSAIDTFLDMAEAADHFVAHNIEYDTVIIQRALARLKRNVNPFEGKQCRCTMKAATPVLKLPKYNGTPRDPWKWPKLVQVHKHFFGEGFDGAHDALVDVRATIKCYRALCEYHGIAP